MTTGPPVKLVFHPPGGDPKGAPSAAFGDALRTVLGDGRGAVAAVSPYLGGTVLGRVLQHRGGFRLVTDLDECLEAGDGDGLASLLAGHLDAVRHLSKVHAKVVLGDTAALIGSANLTQAGFAARDEMGCLIRDPAMLADLAAWFEALWEVADELTAEALEERRRVASSRARLIRSEATIARPEARPRTRQRRALHAGSDEGLGQSAAPGPARAPAIDEDAWEDLVATVRKLTRSRAEAERVLDLYAEALDVAGLGRDDLRLHLNFGPKSRRFHVTVGQREVIWGFAERPKGTRADRSAPWPVGFILDDDRLARRIAARLSPHAWAGQFTGPPQRPTLKVEIDQLDRVIEELRPSWHRAVRAEVERAGRSTYRRKARLELFDVLTTPAARLDLASRAHPSLGEVRGASVDGSKTPAGRLDLANRAHPSPSTSRGRAWWFGFNNGTGGHMQHAGVAPFLAGLEEKLDWPVGQSKPKRLYAEMRPGDRALFWMGNGVSAAWGFLGTATLVECHPDRIVLGDAKAFPRPLTPSVAGGAGSTVVVEFLLQTFGPEFMPLRTVYGDAVTDLGGRSPYTVSELPEGAFEAVVARATARA